MLRGIRTATSNWFGRVITGIILGLIAISFAIWGIGDIFRGFGQSTVASIGRSEITIEQFRTTYNERLQQLARQIGRPVTPDQANALGLPRQLLGQMLAEYALDEDARRMGLRLSDADIARKIMADPTFRGANGQFDRGRFDMIIRQAGYSEARFVTEQRKLLLRREVAETLAGSIAVPQTTVAVQYRFANEQRSIDYVVFDASQAGDIPEPSADELTRYFNDRKSVFRAPEYRTLDVFVLSPDDSARVAAVSDDEARKAYADRRSRYVTPERREVQQIPFPTIEEARAAAQKITAGSTFEQIAAERSLKDTDINLGMVTKAGMLDAAVADAAFKLPAGQVSEPVQGRFGSVLVRAVKIEPEKVQPFEEVADTLKREIATERAKTDITDQHNKIEDERGAGHPLAEILQKLGHAPTRIGAVDRSGRGPDGQPVKGLPASPDLVARAFGSDVGVENDVVRLPGGGYAWIEVMAVTPSRERTLDEVKDRVVQRWRDDEIAKRIKVKADAFADKLKNTGFAEAAASAGARQQSTWGLKRGQTNAAVPAKIVDEVFRTAKDGIGNVEGDQPTTRFVFRVTDVTVPTLDPASDDSKRVSELVRTSLFEEVLGQYAAYLQGELGMQVNERALNQILTGTTN
ncbi:MAG: SurA N-terminal domain-containing protein [Pseudorhodoplanes sp.]|nr:Peptidyl-prolyl cis-trans isomerase D [Pseudorhodoplanes sp.]MBW7949776.1 SurA N-terminal domain-containing protein [Pseudorhodoplanes sp.]